MPNYIKPTFTLTANKNSNSASPGPLSVALSLNATDTLTVDTVTSEIITVGTTHALLIDGSSYTPGLGGTDGGYIWMKNTTASGSNLIYVGVEANGDTSDLAGGTSADGTGDPKRLFTLKVGESAWFPFDYTMDITVDASAASQQLEYWIFDRG